MLSQSVQMTLGKISEHSTRFPEMTKHLAFMGSPKIYEVGLSMGAVSRIRVAPDTELAGYPAFFCRMSGIRQTKPDIRADTGYQKRPDIRCQSVSLDFWRWPNKKEKREKQRAIKRERKSQRGYKGRETQTEKFTKGERDDREGYKGRKKERVAVSIIHFISLPISHFFLIIRRKGRIRIYIL